MYLDKTLEFLDFENKKYPDWSMKKLSEVAKITMGQSPDGKSYSDDSTQTVLIQGNADMKNGRVVPRIFTSEGTKFCTPDDIIMSVRAPVGALAKSDIRACLGRGVCAINANDFIYHYLVYFDMFGGWDRISQGSTFEAVNATDISNLTIPLPSLAEQQQIAEFFSALDERIALTSDKVKLLKEQKQGYLQKILAQEIAFTDDNGDKYPEWEQKKLGDVADFINGFAFKPDHLGNEGTPVIKIKELLDPSDLSVKTTIDVPKSLHLKNGDIIFSWSMTLACRIWNGGPAFLNQHLYKVVVKENCDSEFLNHLMNNELSELRNLMHGGTAKHITRKDLLPYKVMIPSLPEQEKIAEFFSALDEQLELTENKLTLLKEQKKGYLQGIFGL